MIGSRLTRTATFLGLFALLGASGLFGVRGASAERLAGEEALPATYLLQLEEPSTVRTFRLNRDEGTRAARRAARSQKHDVVDAQSEVIEALPADAEVVYRTHSVLAGVGVSADPADESRLEAIPGVRAVYPVAIKHPDNSYAMPFQSAPEAWQSTGYRGEGQTIAVIDSGVDYTHAGFGGPGTTSDYEDAHAASSDPVDPDLIDESKFHEIIGIDLVGDDYNPSDPDSPDYQPEPHPDPNPLDCGGHGSHVAGSAAGLGVNADGSTFSGTYDESTDFNGLKIGPGMAPEARILAIKVFGCAGGSSVVTEAIDRAVDPNGDGDPSDHVDVINLSLGTDFGSTMDGDSLAANAAVSMGVSVVAAAGNAGEQTDVTGSPGDASRVLSVASSVDAESKIDGAEVTIDGTPNMFGITRSVLYDWGGGADLSGPVVAAPAENETACDPYPAGTFAGQVVLVRWHDANPECSSIARGQNLAAAGAGGFIFGSDSEVFTAGINGDDGIPGVLMVKSGADAIRVALEGSLPVTVGKTETNAVTQSVEGDNDKASPFTSRGVHATGNVKPDVTAVGSSVFSVAVGQGAEGVSSSGTSMASPITAGLAALVRQANPDWTPLQVKADIMNTAAHDLYVGGANEPDSGTYGPPRVGAGRIDAELATTNQVLAYNPENGSVSVSFGPVVAPEPVTVSRQVTVENRSSSPVTYDVGYEPINEVPGAEFSVSPSQVGVAAGQSVEVTVTLEIEDPSKLTKAVDPTIGRFGASGLPRETLAEAFGRLLLDPDGPGARLRVPVYASPRPASDLSQPPSLTIHRTAESAGNPDQTATFELAGQGVGTATGDNGKGEGDPEDDIESIAAGFALQKTSSQSPQCGGEVQINCWRLPEEQYSDLKAVGYTSDAGIVADPANARAYFAVAVHRPWAIPSDKAYFQFDFDVDGDDVPDLFLYNSRVGTDDTFVSLLVDPSLPPEERVLGVQPVNGRLGDLDTALYDSDAMVLPVSLAKLGSYGIDAENPRISYGIEAYTYSSPQSIDMIGLDPESGELKDPLSADLFEPAISVTDENGDGPLLEDQPGKELTVTRNVSSYERDRVEGVLMLHFHNRVGEKAQTMGLRGADSNTGLKVAQRDLTAKVEPVADGMPEPTGRVTFRVDGQEVGSAELANGEAVLRHRVAPGATRLVQASYGGDADFEPSGEQLRRFDPRLSARILTRGKNRFGWYRKPVVVAFKCTPRGSDLTRGCPGPHRFRKEGRGQSVRRSIAALDGGRATVAVRGVRIDRTRPVVKIRGVRNGATYRRIRRVRCAAFDRTSGVRSCRIKRKRRGQRVTYRATATDRAGNVRTVRVRTRLRR